MPNFSSQETQQLLSKIETARHDPTKAFRPTLDEAEVWFVNVMLPKRTWRGGMNLRRVYVGPRAIALGNTPDPNGLCGDAAKFLEQEYVGSFLQYTRSAESLRRILWRSFPWNHMANIFVPMTIFGLQKYECTGNQVTALQGGVPYSSVRDFRVLDLYYKQVYTVDKWWMDRGSGKKGTIEIGLEHEVGD